MSDAIEPKLESEQYDIGAGASQGPASSMSAGGGVDEDEDDEPSQGGKATKERRKIEIKFIQDKSRRHITFSKRKAGIMKKAYELSVLTGTQVLLLVVSETGLVYTFTTPKLQPLVTKSEGKNLIQACLNAPEDGLNDEQGVESDGNSQESPEQSPPGMSARQQAAVVNATAQQLHHNQQMSQHQLQQQQHHQQQQQQQQQQQMAPSSHMPHGMPYAQPGHPGTNLSMPTNAYGDSNQVYQQYFGNMQNGNMPNQQQFQ